MALLDRNQIRLLRQSVTKLEHQPQTYYRFRLRSKVGTAGYERWLSETFGDRVGISKLDAIEFENVHMVNGASRIMVIDEKVIDELTAQAKVNPRLQANSDLRDSTENGSQRMLNAIEPRTVLPIHRHKASSETCISVSEAF